MAGRVLHVITTLDMGGAETMLCKLLRQMDRGHWQSSVISLTDTGPIGKQISELGVPVRALGMKPGLSSPIALFRLATTIRRLKPQVIQTWMYHSDLVGGLAAKASFSRAAVVWGIHHSNLDPRLNKRSTLAVARFCALASKWLPSAVVCCSDSAADAHINFGYDGSAMSVIQNGFDTAVFKPDPGARTRLCSNLGLTPHSLLVGMAGRYHPLKDHANFVRSASIISQTHPETEFVLAGSGVDANNSELTSLVDALALGSRVHLIGPCEDMPTLLAGLDVFVNPSLGEAFPTVVGEAMSCGTICVVTDVGDSRRMVEGCGFVVPAADPEVLAAATIEAIELDDDAHMKMSTAARQRLVERYSLDSIAARYELLYTDLIHKTASETHL